MKPVRKSTIFKYKTTASFWYCLGHRILEGVTFSIEPIVDSLDRRAKEMKLPVVFKRKKILFWIVVMQTLRNVQRYSTIDNSFYSALKEGLKQLFKDRKTIEEDIANLRESIDDPLLSDKDFSSRLIYIFFTRSLIYDSEKIKEESLQTVILLKCYSDPMLFDLVKGIISPSKSVWEQSLQFYETRKPSFWVRMFTKPEVWLFEEEEGKEKK